MSGPLDFDDEPREREHERTPAAPAPKPPRPARRPGASPYSWFVGIAALVLIAVVGLNTLRTEGVRSGGPAAGDELIPFAVPLASVETGKGANLLREGSDGVPAACDVRRPDAVNVCALVREAPVVLALFPSNAARCRSVLRQFERAATDHPRVRFVAVGIRGDRVALLARRWSFPVGWDPDGAVARAYGLVGCPQVTFVQRGGEVVGTTLGPLSRAEMAEHVRALT